jgi:trans-aconitate methyltransferase
MNVLRKSRNVVRGLLQRYGPEGVKRSMWNHEFADGRWKHLEGMATNSLYKHLEKYANHGSILDLGCGPGATGSELNFDSYRSYTGVDISDVAIEKAIKRTQELGRAGKNQYVQSDIESYVPRQQYDVLLFGDSLYYVPHQRMTPMLARYSKYLTRGGVFMARLFDVTGKHGAIVDAIESGFDVVEKHIYESKVCVIVFRQREGGPAQGGASS